MTTLALVLGVAAAPRAWASGFQLRDQSGSGQGTAYAGMSAGGSDISGMFFNPAILTRFEGDQLQFGLTEIMPTSKTSGVSASQPAVPTLGIAGTSISGASSTGNIASSATLPTLYAMYSVSPDFKLGLAVNVPFGLTTTYASDWAGRYQAIKSHLETLDITPTAAWRANARWSLGMAVVARRAKAELSQGLDSGYATGEYLTAAAAAHGATINGLSAVQSGSADGSVDVRGSGWAYGYKLGVLYEPSPKLHIGLGYQSAIRETIKGSATFNTSASQAQLGGLAQENASNPAGLAVLAGASSVLAPQTANGSATAVLHLPATISLGAIYDLSPALSLSAELSDTRWSTFKELRVQFSNATTQPDAVTQENWKDAWFMALGATYHSGNAWTYRAGVAKDNSPVKDGYRTPRIPDADRTWLSAGLSYQFTPAFGIDAGYSHLFCKDSTVDLQGSSSMTSTEYGKGNLTATYKNSIDVLAVQARYRF
jgi:long-chain fatty acid transport protein